MSDLHVKIEPAKQAEVKYRLGLKLPYPVDPRRGRARFNGDKKILSIDLPRAN